MPRCALRLVVIVALWFAFGAAVYAVPWTATLHVNPKLPIPLQELKAAKELGFASIRSDLRWFDLEPQRGVYEQVVLAYFSSYLKTLRDMGFVPVIVLSGAPRWAVDLYKSGKKNEFFAAFRRYTARVAEEFGQSLFYYQLWNEPNSPIDFVAVADDPALIAAGAEGIKDRDSEASLIINILAGLPGWKTTVASYFKAGMGSVVDFWTIDYYPGLWAFNMPYEDWAPLTELIAILAREGEASGRRYRAGVMETGFSTFGGFWFGKTCDEAEQVRFINRSLPSLKRVVAQHAGGSVPVAMLGWYSLLDERNGPIPIEDHFGILKSATVPKRGAMDLRQRIAEFSSPSPGTSP